MKMIRSDFDDKWRKLQFRTAVLSFIAKQHQSYCNVCFLHSMVSACQDRPSSAAYRQSVECGKVFGDSEVRKDDHVVLSMATALLCISPFLTVDITVECLRGCGYFLAGVYGGSHLPDADVVAANVLHPRSYSGFLFSGISIVIICIVRVIYRLMGLRFNGRHRHSLHTIFGVSVTVGVIAGLTGFILVDTGWWSDALFFLYAGIFCGGLLHLAEDCCTVTGLFPFRPFSSFHLNGAINTGDYGDRRSVLYAKFLVCVAALVIAGEYVYRVPAGLLLIPVLAVTAFSWFVFYRFSQYLHA